MSSNALQVVGTAVFRIGRNPHGLLSRVLKCLTHLLPLFFLGVLSVCDFVKVRILCISVHLSPPSCSPAFQYFFLFQGCSSVSE